MSWPAPTPCDTSLTRLFNTTGPGASPRPTWVETAGAVPGTAAEGMLEGLRDAITGASARDPRRPENAASPPRSWTVSPATSLHPPGTRPRPTPDATSAHIDVTPLPRCCGAGGTISAQRGGVGLDVRVDGDGELHARKPGTGQAGDWRGVPHARGGARRAASGRAPCKAGSRSPENAGRGPRGRRSTGGGVSGAVAGASGSDVRPGDGGCRTSCDSPQMRFSRVQARVDHLMALCDGIAAGHAGRLAGGAGAGAARTTRSARRRHVRRMNLSSRAGEPPRASSARAPGTGRTRGA